MTINITPEITDAYRAYLDEPVDAFVDGRPILRRDTYPFAASDTYSLVAFAAGFQAGAQPAAPSREDYRDTLQAVFNAVGYTEEYARQWPKEKVSVTFKRWFDEKVAAPAAQPADSAMEVDALRYRYWRAGNAITVVVPLPADGKKKDRNITVIYSANAEPAWGDSLDDAIDRARALVAKETP